jgi:hypothetical protein
MPRRTAQTQAAHDQRFVVALGAGIKSKLASQRSSPLLGAG